MRTQRRGDIIPGFDLRTGEAVGYNRDEWERILGGLTTVRRNGYLIAVDANGLPLYELCETLT